MADAVNFLEDTTAEKKEAPSAQLPATARVDVAAVLGAQENLLKSFQIPKELAIIVVGDEAHFISPESGKVVAIGKQKLLATTKKIPVKSEGKKGTALLWAWAHGLRGYKGPKYKRKIMKPYVESAILRTAFPADTLAANIDSAVVGVAGEAWNILRACVIHAYGLQAIAQCDPDGDQSYMYQLGVTCLTAVDVAPGMSKETMQSWANGWVDSIPDDRPTPKLCENQYCLDKTGGSAASYKKMLKCMGCGVTYYCSVECQKADWKNHKPICKLHAI
jgi:hypothetical protein